MISRHVLIIYRSGHETSSLISCIFFFNDTATAEIYTLSLHDALPIWTSSTIRTCGPTTGRCAPCPAAWPASGTSSPRPSPRSEEHTSELQSQSNLVCRLLLEKKKKLRPVI